MKKGVLLITLAIVLVASPVFAQNRIMSIHITEFLGGKVSGVYEQRLKNNYSFSLETSIWNVKNSSNFKGTAVNISFNYCFYPEGKALNGAYVFPLVSTAWANGTQGSEPVTSGNTGLGLGGGYQYIFDNNISVNASLELTLPLHYYEFGNQSVAEDILPGGTDLKVALGYAF